MILGREAPWDVPVRVANGNFETHSYVRAVANPSCHCTTFAHSRITNKQNDTCIGEHQWHFVDVEMWDEPKVNCF